MAQNSGKRGAPAAKAGWEVFVLIHEVCDGHVAGAQAAFIAPQEGG